MTLDLLALGVTTAAVLALAALLTAAWQLARPSEGRGERLADTVASAGLGAPPALTLKGPRGGRLAGLVNVLSLLPRPRGREERARLRARLACAGFRDEGAVSSFLATKLAVALALAATVPWWRTWSGAGVPPTLLVAIVAIAAGYHLPDLVIASRVRQRTAAIERGLADALELLVTCVEAGLGLDGALRRVAGEVRLAYPLLGEELATTFLEVKAGIPRIEAFRRLAGRNGGRDLKSLAGTLAQTEMFGTSVALALRVQAEGLRTRRMHRAEERAGFAAVKMTLPLALCILPALLAIIVGPSLVRAAKALPSITRTK